MQTYLTEFLKRNQLDKAYLDHAKQWFSPLVAAIAEQAKQHPKEQALLVGISGCQGSGKSTLADYLTTQLRYMHGLKTVQCSLDDFYLSRADRRDLAQTVHPLLATRGVPGTHRTQLAIETLQQLAMGKPATLPVFDKSRDDISDKSRSIPKGTDIIIFEGWCVGATAQPEQALATPVNELEATEDHDRRWRDYVNEQLKNNYQKLFGLIDLMVMLKAPSFAAVAGWRLEQEQKLANRLESGSSPSHSPPHSSRQLMNESEINRFVQFYQRITEHLLVTLPGSAYVVYSLTSDRTIESCSGISNPAGCHN